MSTITQRQRAAVEQALTRALRARYPGRPVRVGWNKRDALVDPKAPSGRHENPVKHAA